jgi:Flp pilus assembly protein TadD
MNRTGEAAGAYRQGLELVRRALLDNPSDGYARSLAGYFAARLGDAAGGELEIGQALRFAPQDVKVLRIAVLTYETLRQREKALALLRNAPPDLLRELDRQPDMADFRLDPRFQQLVTQAQTR